MSIAMKLVYKILKVYWKITKPVTTGVRALLITHNKVLLVKHTYQNHWYLPGGGVKKGELYHEAIKREIYEELNGEIYDLTLFGVYNNFFEYKSDTVVIFYSNNFTFDINTSSEIENVCLFPLNALPNEISPGSKRRIDEYLKSSFNNYGKW